MRATRLTRMLPSIALLVGATSPMNGQALTYSTYVGGTERRAFHQPVNAVAVDSAGNAYITGTTQSADFPVTPGALQTVFGGGACSVADGVFFPCSDAFVTKFDRTGKVVFSTFLGAGRGDSGGGIALDTAGNIYVTGGAGLNFPTTAGALHDTTGVYIAKLNRDGTKLLSSAVVDLGGWVSVNGFAVDAAGNAYLAGQDFLGPGGDAFVAKVNSTGSAIVYKTYLRGAATDLARDVAVDLVGNAYVTGETFSTDFPTTPAAFQHTSLGLGAAFVAKLNPGGGVVYSTYLGGTRGASGAGIAVDGAGAAYITGSVSAPPTESHNFHTTPGVPQPSASPLGTSHGFVAKLDAAGSALVYATFLGGNGEDEGSRIAVSSSGEAHVVGSTSSTNFPRSPGGYPYLSGIGGSNAFLTKLNANGTAFLYSTCLGGMGTTGARGIAIDPTRATAWVAGQTNSPEFPTTPDALQPAFPLNTTGFASKFDFSASAGMITMGVVNSASLLPAPIAPGELVTIFGAGVGPQTPAFLELDADGKVATTLAGVRVTFDGWPAPLTYVSSGQINAVVPYAVNGKTNARLQVDYNGQKSDSVVIAVADTAPGVFTVTMHGRGQGAILNQDGTLNSPANPAEKGSIVSIWANGMGQTDPPGEDGKITTAPLPVPRSPVYVWINGIQAPEITYAGAAPQLVSGVLQVNVRLPLGIPSGSAVAIALTMGYAASPWVTLAVK
ncbi:MAG TPA: SBBP repeat-containing protein [Bryobacteraceae bacterium]|nr:SBBP repeat-containing protein [Bryobacteraceae bacterium]